jgi:hypothetical protein
MTLVMILQTNQNINLVACKACKSWGFDGGGAEDLSLLGCGAVSLNVCSHFVYVIHTMRGNVSSNKCTPWYTIYDVHQLLHGVKTCSRMPKICKSWCMSRMVYHRVHRLDDILSLFPVFQRIIMPSCSSYSSSVWPESSVTTWVCQELHTPQHIVTLKNVAIQFISSFWQQCM